MKTLPVAAVIILSSMLIFQALSAIQFISIPSGGTIIARQSIGINSQMRGVSIASTLSHISSWSTIASTLASYGVNFVDINTLWNYKTAYNNSVGVSLAVTPTINYTAVVNAFHTYGIQVYCHFSTMYKEYQSDGIDRNCWYIPSGKNISQLQEYWVVPPGDFGGWLDIANPASWQLIKKIIDDFLGKFPTVDGFVLDYTRWDDTLMPLGPYDQIKFTAQTGLDVGVNYTQWVKDMVPVANGGTGKYFNQFMEWRTNLINEFVKNITQEARSISPNLIFGASPHKYTAVLGPAYWRHAEGQDFNWWIKEGCIQWVAPMIYDNKTNPISSAYTTALQAIEGNATGGAHGLIPICPYITNYFYDNRTTSDVAAYVNAILNAGGDGWLLAEYMGPGVSTYNSGIPDIRPYLSAMGLPNPTTFILSNVSIQTLSSSSMQISWTTTKTANSTVEYSSSPLYTWAMAYDSQNDFDYWKITHVAGTLISNSTVTTMHTVIITGLTAPYYIHITSGDSSGAASVYKFYTGG